MSEGRIYAQGDCVMIEQVEKVRPDGITSITMGGPLAEAQDAATAAEIAKRCDGYPVLRTALADMLALARARSADLDPRTIPTISKAERALALAGEPA